MSLRSPLGRARGLGSAKHGTHHFWVQRLTAIALVPLSIWFVIALVVQLEAGHAAVVAWIRNPMVTGLLLALLLATFYHLQLGVQVIIEDYVHTEWKKLTSHVLLRLLTVFVALLGVVSVLKISFGGA